MNDSWQLCEKLLQAKSEEEIDKIIKSSTDMSDARNWQHLNNNEDNWGIVSNQSSSAIKALTELLTNSTDALMMKKVDQAGIPFDSDKAPQSMQDCKDKFFSDDKYNTREFARKNLYLGVMEQNCCLIADNGIGQHPDNMPQTLLSFSKGGKKEIKFVQGRFNMGSSGVLRFCGRKGYRLIITRHYKKQSQWGWALTRWKPSSSASSTKIAEYYGIGKFSMNSLRVMEKGETAIELQSGTLIKLYSYSTLPKGYGELQSKVEENLFDTIFPFCFEDFRHKSYGSHSDPRQRKGIDSRLVKGLKESTILSTSRRDSTPFKEEQSIVSIDDNLGKIKIRKFITEKRRSESFLSRHRVLYISNGQVMRKEQRFMVKSQFELGNLQDKLILVIDMSDLNDVAQADIFMGDRERFCQDTQIAKDFNAKIVQLIKSDSFLKDFNHRSGFDRESIKLTATPRKLKDFFSKNSWLKDILVENKKVLNIFTRKKKSTRPRVDLFYSPSFIEIQSNRLKGIPIEIADKRKISFNTDVQDYYLSRDSDQGELIIEPNIDLDYDCHDTKDGVLKINFKRPSSINNISPSSRKYIVKLGDKSMEQFVYTEIELEYIDNTQNPSSSEEKGKRKPPTISQPKDLPQILWTSKSGKSLISNSDEACVSWEETGISFSLEDGGAIADKGDVIFINYDNICFQRTLNSIPKSDQSKQAERYQFAMALALMAYKSDLQNKNKMDHALTELEEELVKLYAQSCAKVMLSIISDL